MTRCAAACGRDLPDEELIETGGVLVCGPCQESIAKAAERRDSIDDAWRAVEASLPDGYRLSTLLLADDADSPADLPWMALAELGPEAAPDDWLEAAQHDISARGGTPVRALRALARQLSGAT